MLTPKQVKTKLNRILRLSATANLFEIETLRHDLYALEQETDDLYNIPEYPEYSAIEELWTLAGDVSNALSERETTIYNRR